jgi:F-type H+-transporting ATPase subunit c
MDRRRRIVQVFEKETRPVNRLSKIVALSVVVLSVVGMPALLLAADAPAEKAGAPAAVAPQTNYTILAGAAFGVGLVVIGGGYGIGKIGSCAFENMARQPEVASTIFNGMIITAAMVEGATLIALIVCIIVK